LNNYLRPIIARKGLRFLSIAVVIATMASYLFVAWSIPFWITDDSR
jgi:hypothetical protein